MKKINDIVGTGNYFLDSMGFPGNVDKNFMDTQHISTLGFHSLNIIDKIIKYFPNIKILFWCLYVRSRLNNSSYPNWLKYKSIKNRYMKNIIDIDRFTSPEVFSTFVKDLGGHPNRFGYYFLDEIINKKSLSNINIKEFDFISSRKFDFLRGNGDFISEIYFDSNGSIGLYNNVNEKNGL
ncbi:hypothetical protein [Acetobacter aceti]|uniref:hypothetical protein n=1 Tax=Acetobacter aceti TaxID=435 RepID=UPI0011EA589D|nr:hypothetical protein [Acetobacter aceti]